MKKTNNALSKFRTRNIELAYRKKRMDQLSKLLFLILILYMPVSLFGQNTGPSTQQSSYLISTASGVTYTSILSANDSINGYKMCGTPDGLGAFDNGDGTFTLLMNHEFVNTIGAVRAHGSIGSLVSRWIINKSDLSAVSGEDLIQNVYLWNSVDSTYSLYNSANPSSLAAFNRFCSGDLPEISAYYNSATGLGTQERIYMNGEEVSEGRAFAHIVTGPNTGTSWQLPWLGKLSWENVVASAYAGDKTIVAGMDDASITTSNVYFYIGTKTNSGTEIDKAGLNDGKLYSVKVAGFSQERISSASINNPPVPGTHFDLVYLGDVTNLSGASLDAASLAAGATYFSRCEDGAWDPRYPGQDFYFNTTDQLNQVSDNTGSQVGHSRVWHLHFTDPANPELGGTIEAVLDGTEGQNMLDNMTIDHYGHITLLEDVGNASHNGKIWQYTIAADELKMIGQHDPARFGDVNLAATSPFNQDEETSGVIDVQNILGPGMFLIDDQAHYTTGIPSSIVEGGQLLAIYNPDTYNGCINSAAITPSGVDTVCGKGQVTLSANTGSGISYQWYSNGVAIPGATNSTFSTSRATDFNVVEDNGACISTSPTTTVVHVRAPKANVQSLNLDLCTTGSVTLLANRSITGDTYAYLWYQNGVAIPGATSQKIIVTGAGDFSVRVTNFGGCSALSQPVTVFTSCKRNEQSANEASLNLFPNPTAGDFKIELDLKNSYSGTAHLRIVNTLGQIVYNSQAAVSNGNLQEEIKLSNQLSAGNYMVGVIAGDQVYMKQIIYLP